MRKYSNETPQRLRDETGNGLEWCKNKIEAHQILDAIDESESVVELRYALSRVVKLVTGES